MNEPLMPDWAQKEIANAAAGRTPEAELALLRNFYKAWSEWHEVKQPHAKANRGRMEAHAQVLVDAAMAVNAFYHPPELLNG